MISYITQVTICWGLFYALYALWLSKETFFNTNRWYLLSTLIAGLVIPLVEFQTPFLSSQGATLDPINYLETITVTAQAIEANLEEIVITPVNESWSMQFILLSIYWLGVLFFGSRFLYGMSQILSLAYNGKMVKKNNYFLIKTNKVHLPFSFLDFMFWSEEVEFNKEDREKIFRHEFSHIKEKHSIDVLITELLCIFLWCSPFIFLYKNALKNIHEYLADHAVLKDTPTKKYGQLLLKQSQSGLQIAQANNFIHSQLKNRIIMMTKTKSQRYSLLKYTAILPLALLLIFSISAKNAIAGLTTDQSPGIAIEQDTVPQTPVHTTTNETEEIFQVVEEMPRFKGCEDIEDAKERKACADKNMLTFIYSNIKYPALARENNVQGTVVVSFVVEKDGHLSNAKILRDIGAGCGEEVLRIAQEMPGFIPGKQRGKEVRVKYNLPVKFKLEGPSTEPAKSNLSLVIKEKFPNNPLIIIDEKEVESSEHLDPQDIKEINVLKGEAAIKKYGEKGKDGVVEIITLKADINIVGYGNKNAPPPPPPPPVFESNEPFRVVEQMPMFPGTSTKESSNQALLSYIYTNLKYPSTARDQKIEGTVVVNFIITKEGGIKEPKILRSIGGGTDEAVLKVVNSMNTLEEKWTPGMQKGKAVDVSFNLPVKFKLESNTDKKVEGKVVDKAPQTDAQQATGQAQIGNAPAINQLSNFETINIFPNPSNGKINIELSSTSDSPTTVTIADINGKRIFQKVYNGKEVKISDLNIESAATGALMVSFEQDKKIITKEIILQK